MTSVQRTLGLAAGVGLATVLAACGGGDAASDDSTANSSGASATSSAATGSAASTAASGSNSGSQAPVTAGDTMLRKVGGGTVISIDSEKNGSVWEVQVATSNGGEKEAYLSKDGKKIVSGPRDKNVDADDKAENKQEVAGAKLDYKAAARRILGTRSGKITELNLDDYRGGIVWEADVHDNGTKYEVKIDAASGKVVKNERD